MNPEIIDALKCINVFATLDMSILEQIAAFSTFRSMRTAETIFCQGEPSPYCFGVVSGEVLIQHVLKDERFPPKVLAMIGKGGLFGESAFFQDSPRQAMASATQDGKLICIQGQPLRDWSRQNPAVGNSLLTSLLQTSLTRLQNTSDELSIIYGVGRLLGTDKPFADQWALTLEFLKTSLPTIDHLSFYQRSPYWEEFGPVVSFPVAPDLPAIPLQHALVQIARTLAGPKTFDSKTLRPMLGDLKLPWESAASMVMVPLLDWEKADDPVQGLLFMASQENPNAFDSGKHLLLSSVSRPLAEALARQGRQEENSAQERLQQSKNTFRL